MKRINDTYADLSETKVKLGNHTRICSDNAVIQSYLHPLRGEEPGIPEVRFLPLDVTAKERLLQLVPQADLTQEDSYLIQITETEITVYGNNLRGFLYACTCIISHYDNGIGIGTICNVPLISFRAMKIYIPARKELPFFKDFIDLCLTYGFNTLVMEIGGAMEYKRHPEINEGWVEYADIFRDSPNKSVDAQRCMMHNKDSIHWENGGGNYLLQSELRQLSDYAAQHGIEIIPEIPSLSHCDYLLTRHPELAENIADPIPDTYCPLHPDVYPLLFDVIDEVIDVFHPKTVHIAHDEWYSACMCPRCRGKDPAMLFRNDVEKIHAYLQEQGIKTMMWADMLTQCVDQHGNLRGSGMTVAKIPTERTVTIKNRVYQVNKELWGLSGAEAAKAGGVAVFHAPLTHPCIDAMPKDIIMMNWMHHYEEDLDLQYIDRGMPTVYGNFYPRSFKNWFYCIARGVDGIAISNWSMFDLAHMQRMGILFGMAYASMMVWNREFDETKAIENTLAVGHDLFKHQRRKSTAPYTAEVLHGICHKISHELFWDGRTIDYDNDRLGYYHIAYKDGTTEKRDIFYGLNIGVIHDAAYDPAEDPNGVNTHILEATYTCDYQVVGDKIYHRLLLDAEKEILSVTPEIFPQYADCVKVLKIDILSH